MYISRCHCEPTLKRYFVEAKQSRFEIGQCVEALTFLRTLRVQSPPLLTLLAMTDNYFKGIL
jgi:hypothetical protein